jgi:lipid-binding SYLF domain-containing protein
MAQPSLSQDKGKTAAAELASQSQAALKQLYATAALAKQLGPAAHAILVFPKITKAGLVIGGQYGEGALLQKGTAVAYYKTTGASYGLQAGGQQYAYAMPLHEREGPRSPGCKASRSASVRASWSWAGNGGATTTKTLKDDIYAFAQPEGADGGSASDSQITKSPQ